MPNDQIDTRTIADRDPPDFLDLETRLESAERQADALAEMLAFARERLSHGNDNLHVIALHGTQITVGDIIDGALAIHAANKRLRDE